jgi:hypothetical protein
LGFNARDRYFHFRRTFDEGLHAFVENAFESRVRYRYSCHGHTRISGYRITGPLAAVLPSFVESVAGSRDLKRSAQIEFFLKGFGYLQCSGSCGQSILLSVSAGLPLVSLIVVVAIM